MKVKKAIKIFLGALGAVLLAIVLVLLFWLGPTLKLVVQKIGPTALGTDVRLEKLSINPRKGTIHLAGFTIANPEDFGQSNAVSLASLDIAIDMGSIFTETVVVHRVQINSPHFIYEQSSASDNIQEFILSIQEFVGYDPAAPPPPPDPKKEAKAKRKAEKKAQKNKGEEPRIVVVESLVINDVQFHLANTDDEELDLSMGFEQLSVSMTNGTVQLGNFFVSNPGRLETPNLLSLEQLEILLEPGSVYSSNITIHAVNISKPHAFVEHNPETDTLNEFLKIASGLVAKIPTNAPKTSATNGIAAAKAEPTEPPPPPPEVILESITIDDVQVHVVNIGDPQLSVHLGLEQLAVALEEGTISLDNLFFTNPKRLATPNVFSLEGIKVKLAPESLKADTLVIEDLQVVKPYAFLELNKEANTVGEFMKIANGFIERLPTYPVPELPQPAPETEPEPVKEEPASADAPAPIELHNLLIDDIQVKLLDTTPTNNIPDEPHMLAGIGAISVKLVEGNVQFKGITVPNVPGFLATNLVHLANIDIQIDPASLFTDQTVIDLILIDTPTVNLEQTEESGNVAMLQTQLMQFVPETDERATAAAEAPPAQTAATEQKPDPIPLAEQPVVLHQLIITNLAVNLKFPPGTNTADEARFGMALGKLNPMDKVSLGKFNPMDKVSLGKFNPLSGKDTEEAEADPDAPMTLVAFNHLSLEPLKGVLYIDGLRVSNPPDFSRRNLLQLETFRIDMDPDTIQSDILLIEDILLTKPRVRYERHILKDNVKTLKEEIEQATMRRGEYMKDQGADTVVEAIEEASGEETEDKEQKVIIERVVIDGCIVYAKLSALPAIPVPVPIPELKDIGKEKGGASATEASTQIFDSFYEEMINAVGNTTGFAGDALKGIGSLGMNTLDSVAGGATNVWGGARKTKQETEEKVPGKRKKTRGPPGRRSSLR
ncbi:hypothetical protein PDESU_03292 [Pontiella desulfatans]|uniref:AsmA domain-containing protein n=1 Tax=Pontiella desulfatans TaxID=2750659 RepID=A0A6C2U5F1_PONDE|nr:hypothetical protein [Pontiella desulfatans]VGO14724.1 hypothetical protein PDESU_03292 [Pontiella desulfatans]